MKKIKSTSKISPMSKVKRSFTVLIASVMMATTAVSITSVSALSASAVDVNAVTSMNMTTAATKIRDDQYRGHDILTGEFEREGYKVDFNYSDGFFETDPHQYDPHIATMSCNLAYSSATLVNGTDYSQQPYQPQPMGGGYAPDNGEVLAGPAKVFSIISFVCGIVSMISCCWGGFLTGIAAIVFSILAKKKFTGKNTFATLGLVFGIIGLVLATIFAIIFGCSAAMSSGRSGRIYY